MVLTVIGTGFVGVVTSAVFASNGHKVFGLDVDAQKIASLESGDIPFYEPGLKELVQKSLNSGALTFTTDYARAVSNADVVMIAVGTPSNHDGSVNLNYVYNACDSLSQHIKDQTVIAIKSTVPPGTHVKIDALIKKNTSKRFAVAAVPEFLREGSAVNDTLHPDRVVFGVSEDWALLKLEELHSFLPGKRIIASPESASLGKYVSNAYLATRITFANQMADLCEYTGASISEVLKIAGEDKRIGHHYWYPGLGFGGSCFPKDVKELSSQAMTYGLKDHITTFITRVNSARIAQKMDDFAHKVGGFNEKRVAVLGLSFKPNTTDMREAPSLVVVPYLIKAGAHVVGYDPQTNNTAKQILPDIIYAENLESAISDAQILILLVEWDELVQLTAEQINRLCDPHVVVIDTRNQYDANTFREAGIDILQIGNG